MCMHARSPQLIKNERSAALRMLVINARQDADRSVRRLFTEGRYD